MKRIIIVGATSGIGKEVAKIYINQGWMVGMAGRNVEALKELQTLAPDRIHIEGLDVTLANANDKLNRLIEKTGGMDIYFHSSGIGKQNLKLEPSIELNTVLTNGEGFTRMITAVFNYFKQQGSGHLVAISSIAGTKGLGSAVSYSATKAFQNTYLEGLSQLSHMEKLNIRITDIRPGFVDTALLKDGNYPLMLKPDKVAQKIVKAISRNKRVVIIDWKYRILVFFWRMIPRFIWVRLPIKNG